MTSTTSRVIAVGCVTSMDVLVARYCGPTVWDAWGALFWGRTGLLVLAGGMAFTLMDIWSQTLTHRAFSQFDGTGTHLLSSPSASPEDIEGADV